MNLAIVSNLVMDTILDQDGVATESLGGPPCYGGLTATTLGVVTKVVTRFGKNLKELPLSQEQGYYFEPLRSIKLTNYEVSHQSHGAI